MSLFFFPLQSMAQTRPYTAKKKPNSVTSVGTKTMVRPTIRPTKTASITVFYFDDGPVYTLIQNAQVNINNCFKGYDRTVLLKENYANVPGKVDPDIIKKPNRRVFLNQVIQLAQEGYLIDIYILTHGARNGISFANDKLLTPSYLESELSISKTGYEEMPIRMVYQMNCWGKNMNQAWLNVGAKVSIGSRYLNFYPNQMNKFVTEWNKGTVSVDQALNKANTESSRTVMQSLVQADAASQLSPDNWDKCPIGRSVLGSHSCAKSYFTNVWTMSNYEWQNNDSGKENMNYSSYKFRPGDKTLTKNRRNLEWQRLP